MIEESGRYNSQCTRIYKETTHGSELTQVQNTLKWIPLDLNKKAIKITPMAGKEAFGVNG